MPKLLVLVSLALCIAVQSNGQDAVLKGTVKDSADNINLQNAVVYLKKSGSAKLLAYTRAGDHGNFSFQHIPIGEYVMVVSYPGYLDWIDTVRITDRGSLPVSVFLMTRAHLLEEVIVKQRVSPIRIKGDTTEFLADSFHLRPGATVEDLLRVLPGMSVNAKGEITAYGQRVQKVLVDGDEFFGNDPTMATQNLNKNDVAKIQVYDRKSDKATITGIDDGVKDKTVNIVLKDDAKKGYFGELLGGTDFNRYYQGKATISRFTSTLKMGALFVADRSGRSIDNGDFESLPSAGNGIPEMMHGTVMFNQKFGPLGNSTANNFAYSHIETNGSNYTGIKYILPDTSYYVNQYNTNKTVITGQTTNSQNTFKLDSTLTLTANLKYSSNQSTSNSVTDGNVLGDDNASYINKSQRSSVSSADNNNGKLDLYLKKLFNKAGTKFFTLGGGFSNGDNHSQTLLYNKTAFYTGGVVSSQQLIDQKKTTENQTNTAQVLTSYVTPLSKTTSWNLNYTFNVSNADQDIRTYENRSGKYDSLNLLYSNHYKFVNTYHQGGTTFNFAGKKITAKAGFALQGITLKQTDIYTDSTRTRTFVNLFPTASFNWKYSKTANIGFNYNGRTQQPTLAQLQPIRNNDDPLNIQIGNPDLKPAFSHAFSIDFANYKQLSGSFFRGSASVTFIQNGFSSFSTLDGQGRRTFQTINIDGNYSLNASLFYQRDIKIFNMLVSISPDISNRHYTNFINGSRNVTDVFSFAPMLRIFKVYTAASPIDIQFQYTYEFNRSFSSINSELPAKYTVQSINLFLSYFKNGWVITSSTYCNLREKLSLNDVNNNSLVWHLSFEKLISQQHNIAATLKINDVFNQNIGFNRSITSTSVTENTYSTIQRFVMLGLR
ncbi:MAG: outer membrane beta-barrel protein, partial [Sediminibacterium sp.]